MTSSFPIVCSVVIMNEVKSISIFSIPFSNDMHDGAHRWSLRCHFLYSTEYRKYCMHQQVSSIIWTISSLVGAATMPLGDPSYIPQGAICVFQPLQVSMQIWAGYNEVQWAPHDAVHDSYLSSFPNVEDSIPFRVRLLVVEIYVGLHEWTPPIWPLYFRRNQAAILVIRMCSGIFIWLAFFKNMVCYFLISCYSLRCGISLLQWKCIFCGIVKVDHIQSETI